MGEPGEITRLLKDLARGDKRAEQDLVPLVYAELRRIAARYMRRESTGHTLQTTALVHEAYLRLAASDLSCENRSHFFAVAARVMRRILVDHARARGSEKRGADLIVDIPDADAAGIPLDAERLIAVDAALTRLEELDQRQCRIVELRFFAGMTVDETAEALSLSPRTVKRDWQLARAWLYGELSA